MTTTIEHDPNDGCDGCPFERCLTACNAEDASDDDCPLRNGGVHVRAPLPVADHHEPADGDAVKAPRSALHEIWAPMRDAILDAWRSYEAGRAESALVAGPHGPVEVQPVTRHGVWTVHQSVGSDDWWSVSLGPIGMQAAARASRDEAEAVAKRLHAATPADFDPTAWVETGCEWMKAAVRGPAAVRAEADGDRRAALGTIAITLGMDTDALPGAVVERVEGLVRERGEIETELRYVRGGGTFADACALLMGEARDGEGVVDTARRLIVARDEAVTEGERRIAAVERERGQLLATLEDVAARIAAHAALDGLDAGRPSGVVLSAGDERALRGAVEILEMAPEIDARPEAFMRYAAAARATRKAWIEAGRPLASKEGA